MADTKISALTAASDLTSAEFAGVQSSTTKRFPASLIDKAHVGLGNADNTSDANKPVSTATQTALDGKATTSHSHIIGDVTGLQTALDGKADTSHTHGGIQLVHTYVSDETSLVSTNQPVAERFFLNTHRYVVLLDLTNYTQCRLIVNKQTVAANAGAVMTMKYRAAGFSTSVGNYSDIGTSAVTVATDVQNSLLSSGWVDLAEAAKADVAVCVTEAGGNAVLDPQFGYVCLQFK